jgi:hypothetical protein
MVSENNSENKGLTARERWLREHREVRLYFKQDEYELLESLASGEGLTVKDFILKLIGELRELRESPYSKILEKMGVDCRPTGIARCVNELSEKLLIEIPIAEHCKEILEGTVALCRERLEGYEELLKAILKLRSKGGWRSSY